MKGLELAVKWAQSHLSSQTDFIHYYAEGKPGDPHETIPVVHNALYVLVLLRQHQLEKTKEAKERLARLLPFQEGTFPIYLHEYPSCRDRLIAARLLPIFCAILSDYGPFLGKELHQQLLDSALTLFTDAKEQLSDGPAPPLRTLAIATMGEGLPPVDPTCLWISTEGLGTFLQLNGLTPKTFEDPKLLHHVSCTYSAQFGCYVGPAFEERQVGSEPMVTPYDIYMAAVSGRWAGRLAHPCAAHLWGSLLKDPPPVEVNHVPQHTEGKLLGRKWSVEQTEKCALSLLEGCAPKDNQAGWHPLRLFWGDLDRVHTLVCQEFYGSVTYQRVDGGVDLMFALPTELPCVERSGVWELSFFVDRHPQLQWKVNQAKATLFSLGDTIVLTSGTFQVSMTFELVDGSGDFIGNILPDNRPAQLGARGCNQFEAYDLRLGLRTLRRSGECQVRVKLRY